MFTIAFQLRLVAMAAAARPARQQNAAALVGIVEVDAMDVEIVRQVVMDAALAIHAVAAMDAVVAMDAVLVIADPSHNKTKSLTI